MALASAVQALESPSHCAVVEETLQSQQSQDCSRVRALVSLATSEVRGFSPGRSRVWHCKAAQIARLERIKGCFSFRVYEYEEVIRGKKRSDIGAGEVEGGVE